MAKCKTCRKEGARKRNPAGTCVCKKCWNMLSEDAQESLAKIGKPKAPEPVTKATEKESSGEDELFEDEEGE